jgi:hypothetical protein
MMIVDTRECDGLPNHTASLLAGAPVNGTVFVASYKKPDFDEQPPFAGLSIPILKKILELRKRSSALTTGMANSEKDYVNFENLLDLEIVKHAATPVRCFSELTGDLLNKK